MPQRTRDQLSAAFPSIARERLDRLDHDLVRLEKAPDDPDLAQRALREIHTLKGEARMMGFAGLATVAHLTEDLLHRAQAVHFRVPAAVNDTVLEGFDLMRKLAVPNAPDDAVEPFRERVAAVVATPWETISTPTASAAEAPAPADRWETSEYVRVGLDRLNVLAESVADLRVRHARQEQTIARLEALAANALGVARRGRTAGADLRRPGDLPRVQLEARLAAAAAFVDEAHAVALELGGVLAETREQSFEDGLRIEDVDRTIRDLRFLPVATLLTTFPRTVRDIAREQGKRVAVEVDAGGVAVDKQVLDRLAEPLLHLVRNGIDHGIGTPAERRAAGLPEEGRIRLSARQIGASVEIEVADDGRGLDLERIRARAVERGLVNRDEAAGLAWDRLAQLIFLPGFSTRDQVTDVSGRGIGLAVVERQVAEIGGSTAVHARPGGGTRFVVHSPVSMVLSRALLVRDQQALFALSADAVREVVVPRPEEIELAGSGVVWNRDGVRVPLADLAAVLGRPAGEDGAERPVVVIEEGGRALGLRVGSCVGETEVVRRPLDRFVAGVGLVGGTVSLPGGELALVLDVAELVREATFRLAYRAPAPATGGKRVRTILVVDDSEFTRDMVVGILRDMEYRVLEAVNGRIALEQLAADAVDLVVTDLEMPVLDGFGFLKELRATPGRERLPVVVLSTRGSDEDRRRAADLGADAYLTKDQFHEEALARTVRRFLVDA